MAFLKDIIFHTLISLAVVFLLLILAATGTPDPAHAKIRFGKPIPRPEIAKTEEQGDASDDGDPDGAMGEEEKAAVEQGTLKPEDAQKLPETETGRFVMKSDQPIFEKASVKSKLVGHSSALEEVKIVTPGVYFHRVRFSDSREGYVRTNEVIGERKTEPTETECKNCELNTGPIVTTPPVSDLSKIAASLVGKCRPPSCMSLKDSKTDKTIQTGFAISQVRVKRLITAADHQARVCRIPARYLWKRKSRRAICGNHSKGKCYAGVKDALMEAGITKTRLPGEAAKNAHYGGTLRRAGMRDIMPQLRNKYGKKKLQTIAMNAPAGAVLVYDGGSHGYGHIEIKTGKSRYCSDYCKDRPANTYLTRRLIGVYIP